MKNSFVILICLIVIVATCFFIWKEEGLREKIYVKEKDISKFVMDINSRLFWISQDKIGYESEKQIWATDIYGKKYQQVSSIGCSMLPSFTSSIDSKYIVFRGKDLCLWMVDINTKREKQLVTNKNIRWFSPIYEKEFISYTIKGEKCLHILDIQTGIETRIEESIQSWWSWSPDGRKIAYRGRNGICIIDIVTDKIIEIAEGGFYPSWSPCGKKIGFFRPEKKPDVWSIWITKPDGKEERLLTKCKKIDRLMNNKVIAWSPDGKQFAYEDDKKNGTIWVMNVENKKKIRLSKKPYCSSPAWSPDGKKIAFEHFGRIFIATLE